MDHDRPEVDLRHSHDGQEESHAQTAGEQAGEGDTGRSKTDAVNQYIIQTVTHDVTDDIKPRLSLVCSVCTRCAVKMHAISSKKHS